MCLQVAHQFLAR